MKKAWVVPPKKDADFVYRMEAVLDLYTQPIDPKRPVICMDEANRQLISEVITPIPMKPGQPVKYDYQYQREGVCNLFMFFEPLKGWRKVIVRTRRTKKDWVFCLEWLLNSCFIEGEVVQIVQDNLNTHNPSAFYEVFEPEKAKRLLDRLEFHFTPKHASWLNMAEIEFSVLDRQCLKRRIPTAQQMQQEVDAWANQRNNNCQTVDWQFTTIDARIKLKRLYPSYSQ